MISICKNDLNFLDDAIRRLQNLKMTVAALQVVSHIVNSTLTNKQKSIPILISLQNNQFLSVAVKICTCRGTVVIISPSNLFHHAPLTPKERRCSFPCSDQGPTKRAIVFSLLVGTSRAKMFNSLTSLPCMWCHNLKTCQKFLPVQLKQGQN